MSEPIQEVVNVPEKQALEIIRYNKANPPKQIRKETRLFWWDVVFKCRSKNSVWGRFGGGWNWKLGLQAGGNTLIVSLLVCEFIISKRPKQ